MRPINMKKGAGFIGSILVGILLSTMGPFGDDHLPQPHPAQDHSGEERITRSITLDDLIVASLPETEHPDWGSPDDYIMVRAFDDASGSSIHDFTPSAENPTFSSSPDPYWGYSKLGWNGAGTGNFSAHGGSGYAGGHGGGGAGGGGGGGGGGGSGGRSLPTGKGGTYPPGGGPPPGGGGHGKVPEPVSVLLLVAGLSGIEFMRRTITR